MRIHWFGVLVLTLLLGAAVWLLWQQEAAPPPAAPGAVAAAGSGTATPEIGETGAGATSAGDLAGDKEGSDAERLAIDVTAASGGEAMVTGILADERGVPIAGAKVSLGAAPDLPDFARPDRFDAEAFAAFDPTTLLEQMRQGQRRRLVAETGDDGRFQLPLAGRGGFLQARASGFQRLDRPLQRPASGRLDLGVLTLRGGAVIRGRVTDGQGNPVAGARVSQEQQREGFGAFGPAMDFEFPGMDVWQELQDGDDGRTDAMGRFALEHAAPGDFALRARHPEHPAALRSGLQVRAGQTLADVLITLEPGAVIAGRVLALPQGTKVRVAAAQRQDAGAGGNDGFAAIWSGMGELLETSGLGFGERTVDAGPDGSFELRGLRPGRGYRVFASYAGDGFAGGGICSAVVEVNAGTRGIELRYDPGATVTLQLVDGSGAPIEQLWVRQQLRGGGLADLMAMAQGAARGGLGERLRRYPEGRVTITNLRPRDKQTLSLQIDAIGHAQFTRDGIPLQPQGTVDLGRIVLAKAPLLTVVVEDALGAALASASVRLSSPRSGGDRLFDPTAFTRGEMPNLDFGELLGRFGAGPRQGRTDATGRCVLNALPGSCVLTVQHDGHAPFELELTLPAGDSTQLVKLLRGGSVEVAVRGADGEPASNVAVDHAPPSGRRDRRQTDARGIATFERLAPGTHRFRVGERGRDLDRMGFGFAPGADAGNETGWSTAQVQDGAATKLQLSQQAKATLRGIVRENGVPLANARVRFATGSAEERSDPLAQAMAEFGGGRGRSTRTAADGTYKLDNLPTGTHRLEVQHEGRSMPATVAVVLIGGDNVCDVELASSILRGVVRGPDGTPIAGATIRVRAVREDGRADPLDQMARMAPGIDLGAMRGGRSSTKTAADGSYEVRGVQSGVRLQVSASADGHAAASSAIVEVPPGGVRAGVDVELQSAGSIQVTYAAAPAFAAARAVFLGAGGNPDPSVDEVVQMLRRGSATLPGLRPGRWRITLAAPTEPEAGTREVEVRAGEATTVVF